MEGVRETKSNEEGLKLLLCYLEIPLENIYYYNLSFKLYLVEYRKIKFLYTKLMKSHEMRAQETSSA